MSDDARGEEWFVMCVTNDTVEIEKCEDKPRYDPDKGWGDIRVEKFKEDRNPDAPWGAGSFIAGVLGILHREETSRQ